MKHIFTILILGISLLSIPMASATQRCVGPDNLINCVISDSINSVFEVEHVVFDCNVTQMAGCIVDAYGSIGGYILSWILSLECWPVKVGPNC